MQILAWKKWWNHIGLTYFWPVFSHLKPLCSVLWRHTARKGFRAHGAYFEPYASILRAKVPAYLNQMHLRKKYFRCITLLYCWRKLQKNNVSAYILFHKVHIFWEGHKILRNLLLTFVLCSASQKQGGDFAKFCGLLRIYELYARYLLKNSISLLKLCKVFNFNTFSCDNF